MKFPIYTTIYGIGLLFAWPYFRLRGIARKKYHWHLISRVGSGTLDIPAKGKAARLWVHALSLGEVISAETLVQSLSQKGYEVIISTTTLSGAERAKNYLSAFPRFIFPLDWPPLVTKVINRVNPDAFIVIETDVWPNVMAGLAKKCIPTMLVGARVSPRSFRSYKILRSFWGRVLNLFSRIGCQSESDLNRLIALGAPPERTFLTGTIKFDRPILETGEEFRRSLMKKAGLPDGIWIVAGSTHAGEEKILLSVFSRLKDELPSLRLLIAPRDEDRFESVWKLIQSSGYPATRRSSSNDSSEISIFLLDTLGELDDFYEVADIAFVGKSLPLPGEGGGHNLIEPAFRSKPVLFGPRIHDFTEIAQLLIRSEGGRMVHNTEELAEELHRLAIDPIARKKMGRLARAAVEPHRGALKRNLEMIEAVLRDRDSGTG